MNKLENGLIKLYGKEISWKDVNIRMDVCNRCLVDFTEKTFSGKYLDGLSSSKLILFPVCDSCYQEIYVS